MIRLKRLVLAGLLAVMMLTVSCRSTGSGAAPADGQRGPIEVYNKFNIHVVESISTRGTFSRASYANWVSPFTEHWIIPPATKLSVIYRRRGVFPGYEMTLQDNRKVYFEFNARNTGMSAAEYLNVITSSSPVSHQGISTKDQEGIRAGKASIGMTKRGVRIALGHPASSRTPSLKLNRWIYWRDRYRTMVVQFDESGNVTSVR